MNPYLFILLISSVFFAGGCRCPQSAATDSKQDEYRSRGEWNLSAENTRLLRSDSIVISISDSMTVINRWHREVEYHSRSDTIIRTDTVYINRDVKIRETVEVNVPTGWQYFQIYGFRILSVGLLIFGALKFKIWKLIV